MEVLKSSRWHLYG